MLTFLGTLSLSFLSALLCALLLLRLTLLGTLLLASIRSLLLAGVGPLDLSLLLTRVLTAFDPLLLAVILPRVLAAILPLGTVGLLVEAGGRSPGRGGDDRQSGNRSNQHGPGHRRAPTNSFPINAKPSGSGMAGA